MRKLSTITAVAVALVATSIAVAAGIEGARSATSVAATFTATQASTSTKTCTTQDGKSISVTTGRYVGTATGDAALTGAIALQARSVVDTTDGLGAVSGQFKVDVASGRDTIGSYTAVYDHGSVAGLATAKAGAPAAQIIGNLSATFAPASGFTGGKIGGGTAGGSAVAFLPGPCKPVAQVSQKSEAHGTVSAVSSTSITVAGLTCSVPSSLADRLTSKLHLGDRAVIQCSLVNGQNTLVAFRTGR